MREIRAAIHGRGKYALSEQAKKLRVSHETWVQLKPDQRSRRVRKLLGLKTKPTSGVTTASGHLTIPAVSRLAEKSGSRKRVNATTSSALPNKRAKLLD